MNPVFHFKLILLQQENFANKRILLIVSDQKNAITTTTTTTTTTTRQQRKKNKSKKYGTDADDEIIDESYRPYYHGKISDDCNGRQLSLQFLRRKFVLQQERNCSIQRICQLILTTKFHNVVTNLELILTKSFGWKRLKPFEWHEFCRIVGTLSNLQSIGTKARNGVRYYNMFHDETWMSLLQALSPPVSITKSNSKFLSLKSLSILITGTFVSLLQQLPIACPYLQQLNLSSYCHVMSIDECQILSQCLQQLTYLSSITLNGLKIMCGWVDGTYYIHDGWTPLFHMIRQNLTYLVHYEFNDFMVARYSKPNYENGIQSVFAYQWTLTEAHRKELDFYPRLNKAGWSASSNLRNNPTQAKWKDWAKAIINVRDRVDCIHFLITRIDPELLATSLRDCRK